jgi:hypothetical protein
MILDYLFHFLDTAFIFAGLIFISFCLATVIGILFEPAQSFEPEITLWIDENGNLVPKDNAPI